MNFETNEIHNEDDINCIVRIIDKIKPLGEFPGGASYFFLKNQINDSQNL